MGQKLGLAGMTKRRITMSIPAVASSMASFSPLTRLYAQSAPASSAAVQLARRGS